MAILSPLRTRALILTVAATVGFSTGASAANSNPAEMRGFNRCVAGFDASNLTGVTLPRVYYIATNAESKTYYLNTSAWQDGVRVAKRVTCKTSRSGRDLYSVQSADGRYALSNGRRLNVAER